MAARARDVNRVLVVVVGAGRGSAGRGESAWAWSVRRPLGPRTSANHSCSSGPSSDDRHMRPTPPPSPARCSAQRPRRRAARRLALPPEPVVVGVRGGSPTGVFHTALQPAGALAALPRPCRRPAGALVRGLVGHSRPPPRPAMPCPAPRGGHTLPGLLPNRIAQQHTAAAARRQQNKSAKKT